MSELLSLCGMVAMLATSGTLLFFTPLYGHLLLGRPAATAMVWRRSDLFALTVYALTAFVIWRSIKPHPALYPFSYRSLQISFPLFTVSYWTLMRGVCSRLRLHRIIERTVSQLLLLPLSQLCLGLLIQSSLMTCSVILSAFEKPQPDSESVPRWWVAASPVVGLIIAATLICWLPRFLKAIRYSPSTDNLGVAPE